MAARRSGQEVRAAAVEAAAAFFASSGVAATTMEDIVEQTGITRATLYRHIGNKEDLVLSVLLREIDELLVGLLRRAERREQLADVLVDGVLDAIELIRARPLLLAIAGDAGEVAAGVSADATAVLEEHFDRFIAPIFEIHASSLRPDLTQNDAVEVLLRTILSHLSVDLQRRTKADRRAFLNRTLVPVFLPDEVAGR
jgi:AcrR family transcriptional regulator